MRSSRVVARHFNWVQKYEYILAAGSLCYSGGDPFHYAGVPRFILGRGSSVVKTANDAGASKR
jgi:hypothetical protein